MPAFDKWWNDTKKHEKRVKHWLPHLRDLVTRVGNQRSIRYFTLCARPMIDVFMLVKEGILPRDTESRSIGSVRFCECEEEHFGEIKELIAREDAGFFGKLEELILFEDDNYTGQFLNRDNIAAELEREGEALPEARVAQLQLKRTFLDVRASFPYDYVNLDFCDYYYPIPDMLKINKTVERILDWQSRSGEGDLELNDFVMAVTCRHDCQFPAEARQRIAALLQENCDAFPEYKAAIQTSRQVDNIKNWVDAGGRDTFLAGWPKDIARAARLLGWKMEILEYVYYDRADSEGEMYMMVCAVLRFTRPKPLPSYLASALYALEKANRKFIPEIPRDSERGKELIANLATIVELRNDQARIMEREELPNP